VKSLDDLIKFNVANEARAMPFFKQEIFESSQKKGDLTSKEYLDIHKTLLTTTRDAINATLRKHELSAICGPTNGPSWCIDLVNGDSFTGYGMYSPAAVAGYPSVSVPMGSVFGLPIGISFIGTAYAEQDLISIAYAYEQASKKRVKPEFKGTGVS
jgi:amidase